MDETQTVFVVDDNAEMRLTLSAYLRAAGLKVTVFESALAFLQEFRADMAGCLVLDIKMPEMSGLELQEALNGAGSRLPVIVVSGEAAVMDAVRAVKQGSFEFMEKPYAPNRLLAKIKEALEFDAKERARQERRALLLDRFRSLSERERRVLALVVRGLQSKAIADQLAISTSTVDNHRSNIMKKLGAETAADLTRLALLADPSLALLDDF